MVLLRDEAVIINFLILWGGSGGAAAQEGGDPGVELGAAGQDGVDADREGEQVAFEYFVVAGADA